MRLLHRSRRSSQVVTRPGWPITSPEKPPKPSLMWYTRYVPTFRHSLEPPRTRTDYLYPSWPSIFPFCLKRTQAIGLPGLPLQRRKQCLSALCRICGRWSLLPSSLQIQVRYNPSSIPQYRGGFADVWKGDYQGRSVAAKVVRVYSTSDFDKITRVRRSYRVRNLALTNLRRSV